MARALLVAVVSSAIAAGSNHTWGQELQAPASSADSKAASTNQLEFLIGVADILNISVWKEEELRATVPVRPDGKINVPLLGEVTVAGRTPLDVQIELTNGYQEFVAAPAVSLVVTEINSRKVYVLGEVAAAGVYDIIQPTNLLQALAMAGGFTDFAKKDEVVVIRPGISGDSRRVVSVKDITSGREPGDNILLVPGDTIYVP